MNILLYIIIFIMGTFFGSFFTLAVYRIPKRQDITHTHSYCPNCNHKLGILDLIPVWSYIFLGGKCRYCKQKIRPRYLILEILSGLAFVMIAYLININVFNLNNIVLAESAFLALYLCFIFIMGGIDKENRKIEKTVVVYGIIISIAYIIYLCIVEKANIYRYVIYLVFYILILILDTITLRKYAKNSYTNGIVLTIAIMAIFTGEYIAIKTVIFTCMVMVLYLLINKIKNKHKRVVENNISKKEPKTEKQVWKTIPIGFYLAISNVLNLLYVLIYYKFFV